MNPWRYCFLCFALLAFSASVVSPLAATPDVSGRVYKDYARISFTWPEHVKSSAALNGRRLTVHFDKSGAPNLGSLLATLSPYVQKADIAGGGKTIIFTLNGDYRIRSFISEKTSGVDILGIHAAAPPASALAAKPVEKPAPAKAIKTAEPKKKETPKKEEKKTAQKETPKFAAPATTEAKEKPKPVETVQTKKPEKVPPTPPTDPNAPLKVTSAPERERVSLIFPWEENVSALAFKRAGYVWVMFSRAHALDLSALGEMSSDFIASITPLEGAKNATLLRVATYGEVGVAMRKAESGNGWVLEISRNYRNLATPLTPKVVADAAIPHVTIPAAGATMSVTLTDPDIGDELTFIPLPASGAGMFPSRRFVDFALPATAQGIVVQKISDHIDVAASAQEINITSGKGLALSPPTPPPAAPAASASLFPYAQWKLPDNASLTALRKELTAKAEDTSDSSNRLREQLAQYYLSEGLAAEALGVLNDIRDKSPEFYTVHLLAAMRGAANFLMFRITEASEDFAASELNDHAEIKLWREVCDELLGKAGAHFDFVANDESYIHAYPPPIRQKLAIIAADIAIARKEYNTALTIFDHLSKDNQLAPIQKYVDYMTAKISAETGQPQAAQAAWEKMAQNLNDSFVRARAEYSLVGLLLQQGKITRDEAIDRLDKLRVVWRGDSLEMNLLELLGNLYAEKQDYTDALRVMKEVVTNFPTSPEATTLSQKMAEIFAQLFNGGKADSMPPLQALALYYEFRELTPLGTPGDEMIRNLSDRLASMDLLDNAAALLNHQVRFRLEKEERSRVGARLALIYLLNKQPQAALDALEMSAYGANPDELNLTRTHLAARALLDLNKQQEALNLLHEDYSPEAQTLKLDVSWSKHDWAQVITLGESALGKRKDITAKLSGEESDLLIKLALAYVFTNDTVQLKYLRDYFGPLMDGNPNKDTFMFITDMDGTVNHEHFDQVTRDIERMQSFLGSYQSKVKKEGLSSAIN